MNDTCENIRPASSSASLLQMLRHGLAWTSRILALLVLIIYAPVIVAAGLLILLTSPGPAFVKKAYRRDKAQEVVYLYELRTECWQTWQPTPLGRWLHRMDIPRLPRLVNVLQGQIHAGERVHRLTA